MTCRSRPSRTASPAPTPSSRSSTRCRSSTSRTCVDWSKKGYFTYGGRTNEAGSEVLQRRVRDDDVELRGVRATSSSNAKFDFGDRAAAVLPGCAGRTAELDHRRRLAVGDERQEDRRVQGRGASSSRSCRSRRSRRSGTRRRATCRSRWRRTSITKKSGFYDKNPGTNVSVEQMIVKTTKNSRGVRARQLRAGARRDPGGARGGVGRQEDREASGRSRAEARRRDHRAVQQGQQGLVRRPQGLRTTHLTRRDGAARCAAHPAGVAGFGTGCRQPQLCALASISLESSSSH